MTECVQYPNAVTVSYWLKGETSYTCISTKHTHRILSHWRKIFLFSNMWFWSVVQSDKASITYFDIRDCNVFIYRTYDIITNWLLSLSTTIDMLPRLEKFHSMFKILSSLMFQVKPLLRYYYIQSSDVKTFHEICNNNK